TTIFAGQGIKRGPIQWTQINPRVSVEYLVNPKLVIRAGAGIYTGYPLETNYQYAGNSFQINPDINSSFDDDQTRYATLGNPFPAGLPPAPGAAAGKTANWGLGYGNNIDTGLVNDGHIYQWNIGAQRTLPGKLVLEVNYAANRSTHLPFIGTQNRNFIPSSVREQYTNAELRGAAPDCTGTNGPYCGNPFFGLFGPGAPLDQPTSVYANDQNPPLQDLLRPYPQFPEASTVIGVRWPTPGITPCKLSFIGGQATISASKATIPGQSGTTTHLPAQIILWEILGTLLRRNWITS